MAPPDPVVLAAIERPADPAAALARADLDRLLDPAPLPLETGWCILPDGVRYVAVRTPMPAVSAEMVEWWFDWHARDPLRYRVWHPAAHSGNSVELPAAAAAKAHWGAVHHPVEDVGTGTVHARIAFVAPSALGFSTDALEDPAVGTNARPKVLTKSQRFVTPNQLGFGPWSEPPGPTSDWTICPHAWTPVSNGSIATSATCGLK